MNTFTENEMPVADLKAVGLHDGGKTAISEEVREQLLRGQVTDFVRLRDIPVNGEKLDIDTKLSLQRTEEGTDLRFHPIYASEQKHDLLSDEEQQNFKEGVHAKHFSAYGKLLDYGDANYRFDNENKMSFFIRLEKADGSTRELWGTQLKDALQKSGFQKGDHIQIDHLGTKPIRTEVFERDENNKVIGSKWEDVRRNEWKIAVHEPKRQREDSVLFEYDRDTKSYVGKNTKAIVAPEEVNGIALTPEQKRKYKEGEQVQLEDGTQIQASPISNIKFNRRMAILSVLLDGGLSYLSFKHKPTGTKATRIGGTRDGDNAAGSRWGLRGAEDLGGGLNAIFQLENGYDLFTGRHTQGGRMFGRAAFLGLQSDAWGTVRAGRYFNFATTMVHDVIGAHGDQFAEANIGATFKAVRQVRYDNYISYESPVFSGFKFGLGYSFQNAGAQPWDVSGVADTDQTAFTTAVRYSNGPLTLAASYDQLNKRDNVAGDKDAKAWIVGASYNFGPAKLHLGYGQDKDGVMGPRFLPGAIPGTDGNVHADFSAASIANGGAAMLLQAGHINTDYKTNNYSVGVSIPTDIGSFALNWGSTRLGSGAYKDAAPKHSQNLYVASWQMPLAKRTSVHVFGAYGTGYAFNDVTVTHVVAGLRHMF